MRQLLRLEVAMLALEIAKQLEAVRDLFRELIDKIRIAY